MRLIDADVLYATLKQRDKQLTGIFGDLGGAASGAAKLVLVQPTVDAVPVVRCRDCEHKDREYGFCHGRGWLNQLVPDDGFCDKGKRKGGPDEH